MVPVSTNGSRCLRSGDDLLDDALHDLVKDDENGVVAKVMHDENNMELDYLFSI
jgi:hypothetical protein